MSAGVGIAARAHVDVGLPMGLKQGQLAPGRATAAVAHCYLPRGLIFISLYLQHTVGWNDFNLGILDTMFQYLNKHNQPWVIGGDWNQQPDELSWAQVEERIGGVMASPSSPTTKGQDPKIFDFFLLHPAVAKLVKGISLRE